MSDGSYDSPTQKFLDSRSSSSPIRSPKSAINSTSASPIANDTELIKSSNDFNNSVKYKNISGNSNTFSPVSNQYRSTNIYSNYRSSSYNSTSSTIQKSVLSTNQKDQESSAFSSPSSANNINLNKPASNTTTQLGKSLQITPVQLSETESDSSESNIYSKSKTISPIKRNNFNYNPNESENDIFDVKLTDAETKLSMKFSKQVSNLGTPSKSQNDDLMLLSDSDSSSSFHTKQPQKSFNNRNDSHYSSTLTGSLNKQRKSSNPLFERNSKNSSQILPNTDEKIALLSSGSETNESDYSKNEFDNKVLSYMNQLKYLSSSEMETSSTSSANVNKNQKIQQKSAMNENTLLPSISDSDLSSESSTNPNYSSTTTSKTSSFIAKVSYSSKADLNLNSESETTSEDSSNQKFARNRNSSFTSNYNTKANLDANLDSETTSEDFSNKKHTRYRNSSFISNYNTKTNLNMNSDSETISEDSSNKKFTRNRNSSFISNYNTKTNLNMNSDSEMTSEDSSIKKYSNLTNKTSSFTTKVSYSSKNDLDLNSDSEASSTSDFKPSSNRFLTKANLDSDSDNNNYTAKRSSNSRLSSSLILNDSNRPESNELNLRFNYGTTPVSRDLDQDMSSSDAFIQTPKFPISSKNNSQTMISDSSEEIGTNYNANTMKNYSKSATQFNPYSTPKNNFSSSLVGQNNKESKSTSYTFKKSSKSSSNNSRYMANRAPQTTNKKSFASSIGPSQANSFVSKSQKINMKNNDDMDSDDELLASLRETIKANEILLNSLGQST